MEFRQLKYTLAVAEEQSFSKAAKKLYIAQPYLSLYIKKLEEQLGIKLFDRSCSPLRLTYTGEIFIQRARSIMQSEENLLREMNDFSEEKSGILSLGISPVRGAYLLPILLPILRKTFPKIHLRLYEGQSFELEEWMNKGLTDLTILSLPIEKSAFSYEILLKENFLIVSPVEHPLSQKYSCKKNRNIPFIDLKLLEKESFILLHKGQALRRIADSLFLQAGYKPNIILETKNYETAHALVSIGMGFTFSTKTVYETYNNVNKPVSLFETIPRFTRTLAIVYKKGKYLSKIENDFIDLVKSIFGNASCL
ncbi:LysR family transcriptional regulator [Pectinatus cerevisiiphilus]|uniref:DNA-binding transcriptional LysR family regulator n=1 Tax=Pectinatus cerevisiiphilus TaxID=86956 RepID=A0A4R3K5V0_9FIRM|nr:LysR family transcriptional regulator [Pectinatus cerevisiiphilus]TCS78218.1 DNA-binding transcriptional LysR family regulator [Pectinatus cerevisiiphilus]